MIYQDVVEKLSVVRYGTARVVVAVTAGRRSTQPLMLATQEIDRQHACPP